MKIGILEEGKIPPDERVPFTPEQCTELMRRYDCKVFVQSSKVRRIPDEAYKTVGVEVLKDISHCDVLFGVKEVPIERLIPDKTYLFFSHTIKQQPYNRDLLRTVLERNIRLIDYECLMNEKGMRVLGFGRYAGIVGAYNGLRMIGLKEGLYNLKKATDCRDKSELISELDKVKLPPIKICLTGRGRVAKGTMEILDHLGIEKVGISEYLNESFEKPVYAQLAVTDYNRRKDGSPGSIQEFFKHGELYESRFRRFYPITDFYIACHYWDSKAPYVYTRADLASEDFRIRYVADISCDIDGPVASTIRPSTIEEPFYGVNKASVGETDFMNIDSLAVMAVDNLPCELPIDASRDFGNQLMKNVMQGFFNNDENGMLQRATIAEKGRLTEKYGYLEGYSTSQ